MELIVVLSPGSTLEFLRDSLGVLQRASSKMFSASGLRCGLGSV